MMDVAELINTIITEDLTRYSGGRDGSKYNAVIDSPSSDTYLEIDYYSKDECKKVEKVIEPLMTSFHPRLFREDAVHG